MRTRCAGWLIAALLAIVAGSSAAVGCGAAEPSADEAAALPAGEAGQRSGAQIFAAVCATCHGEQGEGANDWKLRGEDGRLPPPPLNGDGHTWHHADGVLYRIVRDGGATFGAGSNMPAFAETLTRGEIIAVLEYIKTLWAGKTQDGLAIGDAQRQISEADPYPGEGSANSP